MAPPQTITVEQLSLSPAEQRSYPRWYTDLLLRKRHDTVAVGDLLRFVDNFGIGELDKSRISACMDQPLVVVEPPQFYIYLRLCGHLLQGQQLRKELAFVSAPVPRPKPILSKRKDANDKNPFGQAPGAPVDEMDSFMSLMGGSQKKSRKRVTFDQGPPQVAEAAQRSMQELMRQRALAPQPLVSPAPAPQPQQQPQKPEEDVPLPRNQFANVNIESVLHEGHSTIPAPPPPRKLTPNMTGPGQMVQMGALTPGAPMSSILDSSWHGQGQLQSQGTGIQSQGTGLQAQNTGSLMPQSSGLQGQNTGGLVPQTSGLHGQNTSSMTAQHSGLQTHSPSIQAQNSGLQTQAPGIPAQLSGQNTFPQQAQLNAGGFNYTPLPAQQAVAPPPRHNSTGGYRMQSPQFEGNLQVSQPPGRSSSVTAAQFPFAQQQQPHQTPVQPQSTQHGQPSGVFANYSQPAKQFVPQLQTPLQPQYQPQAPYQAPYHPQQQYQPQVQPQYQQPLQAPQALQVPQMSQPQYQQSHLAPLAQSFQNMSISPNLSPMHTGWQGQGQPNRQYGGMQVPPPPPQRFP